MSRSESWVVEGSDHALTFTFNRKGCLEIIVDDDDEEEATFFSFDIDETKSLLKFLQTKELP